MKSIFKSTKVIITAVILLLLIGAVITGILVSSTGKTGSVEKKLELGEKYLSELKYEDAIIAFQEVVEIEPKNVDAYLGIATAYVALDQPEEAVKWLEQGIETIEEAGEVVEDCDQLYIKTSEIHRTAGNDEKAVDVLERGYRFTLLELFFGLIEEITGVTPVFNNINSDEVNTENPSQMDGFIRIAEGVEVRLGSDATIEEAISRNSDTISVVEIKVDINQLQPEEIRDKAYYIYKYYQSTPITEDLVNEVVNGLNDDSEWNWDNIRIYSNLYEGGSSIFEKGPIYGTIILLDENKDLLVHYDILDPLTSGDQNNNPIEEENDEDSGINSNESTGEGEMDKLEIVNKDNPYIETGIVCEMRKIDESKQIAYVILYKEQIPTEILQQTYSYSITSSYEQFPRQKIYRDDENDEYKFPLSESPILEENAILLTAFSKVDSVLYCYIILYDVEGKPIGYYTNETPFDY
ncbi:MAG: hypothetical protein K0S76_2793 [Herbinix sp.]|jgi:hypothetical protein|nr:hypothetical protein [Herbinix sp.]